MKLAGTARVAEIDDYLVADLVQVDVHMRIES